MPRNLDTDALNSIKLARAFTDPIVFYERMATTGYEPPDHITDGIRIARLEQVADSAATDPIRKASWLETAFAFSTASLQAPLTRDAQQFYKWAMHNALQQPGFPPEDHPVEPPECLIDMPELPDHLRPELARTRRNLKVQRDKHYFNTRYSPDLGVPKAVWTDYHTGSVSYNDTDFIHGPDPQPSGGAPN